MPSEYHEWTYDCCVEGCKSSETMQDNTRIPLDWKAVYDNNDDFPCFDDDLLYYCPKHNVEIVVTDKE